MGSSHSSAKSSKCDINTRSPIDLPDMEPECSPTTYPAFVTFKYSAASFRVNKPPDTVHTVLDLHRESDESYVLYNKTRYDLKHMYVRVPSEHSFGNVRYPMELQLRHHDDEGRILMVSFMIKVAECGSGHYHRKELLSQFLRDVSSESTLSLELPSIINKTHTGFYFYDGSYTNHHCHKATWIVFSRPIGLPIDVISEYVDKVHSGSTSRPRQNMRMEHSPVRYNPSIVQPEESDSGNYQKDIQDYTVYDVIDLLKSHSQDMGQMLVTPDTSTVERPTPERTNMTDVDESEIDNDIRSIIDSIEAYAVESVDPDPQPQREPEPEPEPGPEPEPKPQPQPELDKTDDQVASRIASQIARSRQEQGMLQTLPQKDRDSDHKNALDALIRQASETQGEESEAEKETAARLKLEELMAAAS